MNTRVPTILLSPAVLGHPRQTARLGPSLHPSPRRRSRSPQKSQKRSTCLTSETTSLPPRLLLRPKLVLLRISWVVMVSPSSGFEFHSADYVDDFDDFQSAPSGTSSAAAPKPSGAPSNNANLFDLLNSTSAVKPAAPASDQRPPSYGNMMPSGNTNYSSPPAMPSIAPAAPVSRPSYTSSLGAATPAATATKPTGNSTKSTFDDLFNTSLTSMGGATNGTAQKAGTKSMKDLEQEKAMNSLWGPSTSNGQAAKQAGQGSAPKPSGNGGFDDLLM